MSNSIITEQTTNPRFIPPKKEKKVNADSLFYERIRRIKNAWARAHLSYAPEAFTDKQNDFTEALNLELQERYPDLVTKKLLRIVRVHFPNGISLYEDENGNVDPKVRSALVAVVTVTLCDEGSHKLGFFKLMDVSGTGAGKYSFVCGRFAAPIPNLSFDRNGSVVDSAVDHYEWRYYLKDDKQTIEKLFKDYGTCNDLTCAIANVRGPPFLENTTYKVPSKEEFQTCDIMDLVNANKRGLLGERAGGVKNWLAYKKIEDDVVKSGSASAAELSKISRDDIIEILAKKKRKIK